MKLLSIENYEINKGLGKNIPDWQEVTMYPARSSVTLPSIENNY